MLTTLMN